MFILGVTGASGSGKSTFSSMLEKYGFMHIDTDKTARLIVPKALPKLVEAFGADILSPDGKLDRAALAKKAFSSPENTETLNSITHPLITAEIKEQISFFPADRIVIDGAALFEAGVDRLCNKTVAVTADEKTRLERVTKRDNISEAAARQRFSAQKPQSFYTDKCDYTIENLSYINLIENVDKFIKLLKSEDIL